MALQLALTNTITDYTSLTLTDASGEYNVSTNPTGWGAPNLAIADVNYAHLTITSPNDTEYDIDIVTDLGVDIGGAATYADLTYYIPSSLLGESSGALLPDGVYSIEYRISDAAAWDDGGNDYTLTVTVMTYYEIQQDVYNRIKLVPQYYTCSDCDNQFVKETSVIYMYLKALIASTQYSNTVRFEEILSALQDILAFDTSNCSSCDC